nr:MAG TPA: Nuclear receptor-interacting protein 1 repression 4 [Siphoviridae sp. cthRu26]
MLKNLKYSMQRAKSTKGFDQAKQLLISTARVVEKCLKLLTPRQPSTPSPCDLRRIG